MTPSRFITLLEKPLGLPGVRIKAMLTRQEGATRLGQVWAEYDGEVPDEPDEAWPGFTVEDATDLISRDCMVTGKVVGMVAIQQWGGRPYGCALWVAKPFRRHGIATAMYSEAERVIGTTLTPEAEVGGSTSKLGKAFWNSRRMSEGKVSLYQRYRRLPPDGGTSPKYGTPANLHWMVGDYWTVEAQVPVAELADVDAAAISDQRGASVRQAKLDRVQLPPIDLSVWSDGSTYLIDGNHRLEDARENGDRHIAVKFTFPDLQPGT